MLEHSPKFGTRGLTFAPLWPLAQTSDGLNLPKQAVLAQKITKARKLKFST